MDELEHEFILLLESQNINPRTLDYSIVNKHITMLSQLAQVANCGISIYDNYQRKHLFTSNNFSGLFNCNVDVQEDSPIQIHPEDIRSLNRNGIAAMRHFIQGKADDLIDTKMISEYRILIANKYVRVIEQFRVLEFDPMGKIWLTLCILDISPNQTPLNRVHSKLLNFITGEVYLLPEFSGFNETITLSEREKTVLRLAREGKLSKEISDCLEISIFTVNTHRQRILKKLGANNTAEAISYASRLGLLE